ncbi:lysoplasmalogenase [Legionella maioricensis]|uniref:Lysoplasmalogenase n=1 Tax=Legionella maioricensis TaxID=2896528 RepID=A0A9X2I8D2_9GAMM|nr:lysoplasmalogenase [Legionella maioricensis]MCL9682714.1 lysoplasmalogenase [Legionella maioricensis]MCL9687238.1 lysoplasmalogenase [Legionella maioricensis]
MTCTLPKHALLAFLFTAMIYLGLLSFITYPLTTLLKPIPIICLIIGTLHMNILPRAKTLIVFALSFSLLGDVVLTLPVSLTLELGIGCFLLAHCFYITLFLKVFEYRFSHFVYYLPVLLLMIVCAGILIPALGSLLIPVIIYFCILLLMVFSAFQVNQQGLIISAGALSFMVSDLTLGFNLFVYPQINVRIFIMLSYYLAQLLLIWGLVKIFRQAEPLHSLSTKEMKLKFDMH